MARVVPCAVATWDYNLHPEAATMSIIEASNEIMNDLELQGILWACLDYWSADSCAPAQPVICYAWVARRYKAMFGGTFHHSRLAELERLGVLAQDGDTSRGGD